MGPPQSTGNCHDQQLILRYWI